MPSTAAAETTESVKSKAKYLQEYSQCVFDILQIVKTVIDNPGEHKELHFKYHNLINILENKIDSENGFKFKDEEYSIPFGLIFMPFREEDEKREFYKAEKNLKFLLGTIEEERIKLLGEKYKPCTGIKDKELILLLNKINNGEEDKISTNNRILETAVKISSSNRNEITSRITEGEKILNINSKQINIGLIKNSPNKLWECLSPVGTPKGIDIVFTMTNPIKGKYTNDTTLTISQKEDILKNRFKDLQRFTSKHQVKISLVFNHRNNTVCIDLK